MAAAKAPIVAEGMELRRPMLLAWEHLPQERRLTVADVRGVEQRRRLAQNIDRPSGAQTAQQQRGPGDGANTE